MRRVTGRAGWWTLGQAVALAATVLLAAGLWLTPETALRILWAGVFAVLPALWLVHPGWWRNVCPLASVNTAAAARGDRQALPAREMRTANAVGIALFVVLVPARTFLFDDSGSAVLVILALFILSAALAGRRYDRKAGFCNAICPVLPVERLYGQSPAHRLDNPRCPACTLCVPRGCVDLATGKAVAQVLGVSRRTGAWLTDPFGAFASGFPGFVLGFFLVPEGSGALATYGIVWGAAAASWLLTGAVCGVLAVATDRALPVLAAMAATVFYWFTAADVTAAWGWPPLTATALRSLAGVLIAAWCIRRLRPARSLPVKRDGAHFQVPPDAKAAA